MTDSADEQTAPPTFIDAWKRFFLGKPLISENLEHESLSNTVALGALSPDAISSTVYGPEQIMVELLPAAGLAAFVLVLPIAGCHLVDPGVGNRVVSAGGHDLHPTRRLLRRRAGQLRAPDCADLCRRHC